MPNAAWGNGLNRRFIHPAISVGQRTVFGTIATRPLETQCFSCASEPNSPFLQREANWTLKQLDVILRQIGPLANPPHILVRVPQEFEILCSLSKAAPHHDHRVEFHLIGPARHLGLLSVDADAKQKRWYIQENCRALRGHSL